MKHISIICSLLTLLVTSAFAQNDGRYIWQQDQAKVLPDGNIEWDPQPFVFEAGDQVRFIDYQDGDDDNDGSSKETAWKHHPWDRNATGNAAEHEGVTTYVFRRGVVYRGGLGADESGGPENPIIISASSLDKNSPYYWGEGEVHLFGSTRLPAKWVKATTIQAPDRIPEPDKVWALDMRDYPLLKRNKDKETYALEMDLTGTTRNNIVSMPFMGLFHVEKDGTSHEQHLARTPNWEPGNDNFVLDYWHIVDEASHTKEKNSKGESVASGILDKDMLTGHPDDWFTGGYIWPQYAHFMGTPKPKYIPYEDEKKGYKFKVYDPEMGALQIGGIYGLPRPGLRYMIENLPQYLDTAEEYYFDQKTGFLYYMPPEGQNPNEMALELTSVKSGVVMNSKSNIHINGLTFRYYDGAAVGMNEDVTNVTVSNCTFEHLLDYGVKYGASNWRGGKEGDWADQMRVTDCYFKDVMSMPINITSDPHNNRRIGHVEILRNRIYNSGMRHRDNVQSSVEALRVGFAQTGVIAGNVVERSFGSGIMIHTGGPQGYKYPEGSAVKVDRFPLARVHIFQNKTVDTALGVNDYGGFSLWQGGVQYCYNNNIGNSPGVMPGGISWFKTPPTNLSYPLYLDGAYKIYSFNNLIWARSNDFSKDEYATKTPGYFMVFGFLNQLVNNTFYRTGSGVGGSAGHRNDVLGNVFSEVGYVDENGNAKGSFMANDRTGDPSLVGGGDTGDSGRRGVPTLAFAKNIFHGAGSAGRLLKPGRFGPDSPGIEADTIEGLSEAMRNFPIRDGRLGFKAESNPIVGKGDSSAVEDAGEIDFRPADDSPAIDKGLRYFVPWSLHGTVGEWHFTENHADPTSVMDYSWYMCEPHYNRMMYEFVPSSDLTMNEATLEDYAPSPSEDWANGAVTFDGGRFASVSDAHLRADIELAAWPKQPNGEYGKMRDAPQGPLWKVPEPTDGKNFARDAKYVFPGEHRRTLAVSTENLLLEANFKADGAGVIMGKSDGKAGYQMLVNDTGKAVFRLTANGRHNDIVSKTSVNDGKWRHVIGEVDRETGRMTIYVDGQKESESKSALSADVSIDNHADFLVGKASDDSGYFKGAIDYLRVCHGTLDDAKTTIDELYAWQTDGPMYYDMTGARPVGQRDTGAIEKK
ncbi:MAG: LamG-like jellyroll fold domain-containing protein [bacterium]